MRLDRSRFVEAATFYQLALEHVGFLLLFSILLAYILYVLTRDICGGLSDPIHFFYSFTFGTSYAVVALLAYTHNIGSFEIAIVVGFGLCFLVGFRVFSRIRIGKLHHFLSLCTGGRTFLWITVLLYVVTSVTYVMSVGLPSLSASRFETNRGFGYLARLMDPLRLVIVGSVAVTVAESRGRKRWILALLLGFFAVVSSLLNGSKAALLECAYVSAVSLAIRSGRVSLPMKKLIFPATLIALITTTYAMGQLYLNLRAPASGDFLANANPLLLAFDMFALRIVGNGDMYFLGLSQQVLHALHFKHPFVQLFGPILGSGVTSMLAGYDVNSSDVGRQIILYWQPDYPVAGGPTNHFDLTAYLYFGPIGGTVFVLCLAFTLAQINRLKKQRYNVVGCAVVATLYCRALVLLLNPATSLALMSDAIIIFALVAFFAKVVNAAPRT